MIKPANEGWRLLLFGASGAIGSAIGAGAAARGWSVTRVTRSQTLASSDEEGWRLWDPVDGPSPLRDDAPFDAVCWAQGANTTDSLHDFDTARHLDLYKANVLTVLAAAAALVADGKLSPSGARLVVVSSIWQERARPNKLSYTITKAAVGGLVRAAAVDLGRDGHLVNAVLPGVTDTPMTRANLTAEQIDEVASRTPAGRLADLDTLSAMVLFLCSRQNGSVNGQSLTVDLGMSHAILL